MRHADVAGLVGVAKHMMTPLDVAQFPTGRLEYFAQMPTVSGGYCAHQKSGFDLQRPIIRGESTQSQIVSFQKSAKDPDRAPITFLVLTTVGILALGWPLFET